MKPEVYRCLKILEALRIGIMNMWTNGFTESVASLQKQYSDICDILKDNLSKEEFKLVQIVEPVNFSMIRSFSLSDAKNGLLQRLMISLDMTLAYLRSLDMDLSKEITKKELDLRKREEEVRREKEEMRIKEEEVASLKKVYGELVHIKRGLPEVIRSEVTKEIKKQHREIENHTNSNTKSQQKRIEESENIEEEFDEILNKKKESEEEMKKCAECGKEFLERTLDRYGECSFCRPADRASDMGVGDLNGK